MILYLTLFLLSLNFFLAFVFLSSVNIFFIFLLISQDYFGWYPANWIGVLKYKGDILMLISVIYLAINFKREILAKIILYLRPLYISYYVVFIIYLFCYFLNIYGLNKNLLASRIIPYLPVLITAFALCLHDVFSSKFFLKNYEALFFVASLVVLILNYIILNNPEHVTFFNGDSIIERFDRPRVMHGGVVCIIIALFCKTLLLLKVNRTNLEKSFLYLAILCNYITIVVIAEGRTLFVCLTLALGLSSFLNKRIAQGFLFLGFIAFFIINYSELYFLTMDEFTLGRGNMRFRLELLTLAVDTIKSNLLFGIGIQNVGCSTCLNLPLSDIGLFREIYYFGLFGASILLLGVLLPFKKINKSFPNTHFKDFLISVSVFLITASFVVSLMINYDLILVLGAILGIFMLNTKLFVKIDDQTQ